MRRSLLSSLTLLAAACTQPDEVVIAPPAQLGSDFVPAHFLQFFNKQPSLAAGSYELVVVPAAAGAGDYTLTVTGDDGSTETFTGSWGSTASSDPLDAGNPSRTVTLLMPGGLAATLATTAPACLVLLDRRDNLLARDGDADEATAACDTGGDALALDLPRSHTDAVSYAQAFYDTVDPCDERATLEGFQATNGFDAGEDVHVIFRDTKDLGYGRNMHFRRNAVTVDSGAEDVFAFFVQNFQVKAIPGQNYGPLNLDAAIAYDLQYHIGTNAIEWGPVFEDADSDGECDDAVDVNGDGVVDPSDFFTRHYTFEPAPVQSRRLTVNLDGHGQKAMPVPCILCHGGRADPLLPDGSFPRFGDTKARLQPLDVGSFEFANEPGWTRAEQEAGLHAINEAVYESYAPLVTPPLGEWDSSMAREMLESWYGDDGTGATLEANAFDDAYVPADWVPDPDDGSPPAGANVLYTDVLAQNCRTCHLLRGNQHQSDIDFTSHEKFVGHADQIEPFVYDQGIMPLSFITFDHFWTTSGLPELLASFLPGFSHYDDDGAILRPGRPVANAGPDRTAPSPVTISGSASLFADAYHWSIVSGPFTGEIADPEAVRTSLDGPDGVYELALVVDRGGVASEADTVTITIDSAAADPKAITFADIKTVLQTSPGECVTCHVAGGNPRPPVFWTDPAPAENRDLYREFRARIDFVNPENSRVLRKPSGHHHAGNTLTGFDIDCNVDCDRTNYDLFLNWILEGAPEG